MVKGSYFSKCGCLRPSQISTKSISLILYFATPIGNFLKIMYDNKSTYHKTWSTETMAKLAANISGRFLSVNI